MFSSLIITAALLCFSEANPILVPISSPCPTSTCTPENPVVPFVPSYDAQIEQLVNELSSCIEQKLSPIMDKMNDMDREQFKNIGVQGLAYYIQSMFELVQEENKNQQE